MHKLIITIHSLILLIHPQNSKLSIRDQAIHDASRKYGITELLIRSVIERESGGNPFAKSSAGAKGLMQLTPAICGKSDCFDERTNIMLGTRYLDELMTIYPTTEEALAHYNGGFGGAAYIKKHPEHLITPKCSYTGDPAWSCETANYVKNIMEKIS